MNESKKRFVTAVILINICMAGFIAAVLEQVVHEGTHAVFALLAGAKINWFNLFAVSWTGEVSPLEKILISGSAALVNIFCGIFGVYMLTRNTWQPLPITRLIVLYFTAVSFLAGFGYLFIDPIVFRPGMTLTDGTGDWTTIIAFLGGGLLIRLIIFTFGVAGLFGTFKWLAHSAMQFNTISSARAGRFFSGLPILAVPYLVICVVFSLLAVWHPLGTTGTTIVLFKYWFGYSGFLVALLFMVTWPQITPAVQDPLKLRRTISVPLIIATIAGVILAVVLLLPGNPAI